MYYINTPIGEIEVDMNFFETIKIKSKRTYNNTTFITLLDNQTFSLADTDFITIDKLLREKKLNTLLNQNNQKN
jgi:hypothetical protein